MLELEDLSMNPCMRTLVRVPECEAMYKYLSMRTLVRVPEYEAMYEYLSMRTLVRVPEYEDLGTST